MIARLMEKVTDEEIVKATQKTESEKATGLLEVSVEMIIASNGNGNEVIMDLCQYVLEEECLMSITLEQLHLSFKKRLI